MPVIPLWFSVSDTISLCCATAIKYLMQSHKNPRQNPVRTIRIPYMPHHKDIPLWQTTPAIPQ